MRFLPLHILGRILYPHVCRICGREIRLEMYNPADCGSSFADTADPLVCSSCSAKMKPIHGTVCATCGTPLISARGTCIACRNRNFLFEKNNSLFQYTGAFKQLFLRYKFGGEKEIGRWLAMQAAVFLHRTINSPDAFGMPVPVPVPIVPVPGNPKSIRRRGWDQVGYVAGILKRQYGFPVFSVLGRKKSIQQKTLGFSERLSNISGKIFFKPGYSVPAHVVLFDDIFTTGATVQECTRILLERGTEKVRVVTLAID